MGSSASVESKQRQSQEDNGPSGPRAQTTPCHACMRLAFAWCSSGKSASTSFRIPGGGPITVAGTFSALVERMYITAMTGMATTAMTKNHIRTNSVGLQLKQNAAMCRKKCRRHGPASPSLYNQHTTTSRYLLDHKNCGQTNNGRKGLRGQTRLCLHKSPRAGGGGGPVTIHSPSNREALFFRNTLFH